jgi:hypothetical protein
VEERVQLSFWSGIVERSKPLIQSWIADQLEYLLQVATLAIAYAAFALLRIMRIQGPTLDLLETMDRVALVLVFGRFLYSVVRRAFAHREK